MYIYIRIHINVYVYVFPKRIENVNGHNSMQERRSFLFSYAVAWCGSD